MTSQFVSTWYPHEDTSLTVYIPLTAAADICVNWGDGNVLGYSTTAVSHTYTTSGEKTISISAADIVWDVCGHNAIAPLAVPLVQGQIRGVSECGGVLRLGNSGEQFVGCSKLNWTATDGLDGMSNVTTLNKCFYGCASMTQFPPDWDTSGVTNFTDMFYGTKVFVGKIPQISVIMDKSWYLPDASYVDQLIHVSARGNHSTIPIDATSYAVIVVGGSGVTATAPTSVVIEGGNSAMGAVSSKESKIREAC
jgi:hypothetical protein